MAEVICTTVYQFPELSDAAKEKARSWYRELGPHDDWWDAVYEDFERICDILGVRLKTRPVRLMGGGTREKPCIWFSGFWSQGDGACFEGYLTRKQCEEMERCASVLIDGSCDSLRVYRLRDHAFVHSWGRGEVKQEDVVIY